MNDPVRYLIYAVMLVAGLAGVALMEGLPVFLLTSNAVYQGF